jgi:hypothetical protein
MMPLADGAGQGVIAVFTAATKPATGKPDRRAAIPCIAENSPVGTI